VVNLLDALRRSAGAGAAKAPKKARAGTRKKTASGERRKAG